MGRAYLKSKNVFCLDNHGILNSCFLEVTNDTSDKEIIEFLNKDFDINKFNISLQNLYHSLLMKLSQNGIYHI